MCLHIYIYIHTHTHIYIYIYIYIGCYISNGKKRTTKERSKKKRKVTGYKWDMETADEWTEIGTTSIPSVTQKRTLYAIIERYPETSS